MLLTDDELRIVRQSVEVQAGLDEDLVKRCGYLIHIKAFDEAVRNAFVLLEERLRRMLDPQKSFGVRMINEAFEPNGYFTKKLTDNRQELEGLQHLLLGAFKLYRNPTAHTAVSYSAGESRSVIYLIDLILKKLDAVIIIPLPGVLPENIDQAITALEHATSAAVGKRVRTFASNCLHAGMQARDSSTKWMPFRKYALVKLEQWETARPHMVTVFYLVASGKEHGLWVPVNQYYRNVIGFDPGFVANKLKDMQFQVSGKLQDYYLNLHLHNEQALFTDLLALFREVCTQFDATLTAYPS